MVPSPNLQQPQSNSDASFVGPAETNTDAAESYIWKNMIRSHPLAHMADDESRASSDPLRRKFQKEIREDDYDEVDMEGWLQLSLGSHVTSVCSSDPIDTPDRRDGPTEHLSFSGSIAGSMANLLQVTGIQSAPATYVPTTSPIQADHGSNMNFRQQLEAAWRSYWHGPWKSNAFSSSSSHSRADFLSIDDMRVVDPPLRPPSGLWFVLQAAQNQEKESFLPQLPKSYLRVRDGRSVTVVLLMKYLSRKLGLNNELQAEGDS